MATRLDIQDTSEGLAVERPRAWPPACTVPAVGHVLLSLLILAFPADAFAPQPAVRYVLLFALNGLMLFFNSRLLRACHRYGQGEQVAVIARAQRIEHSVAGRTETIHVPAGSWIEVGETRSRIGPGISFGPADGGGFRVATVRLCREDGSRTPLLSGSPEHWSAGEAAAELRPAAERIAAALGVPLRA